MLYVDARFEDARGRQRIALAALGPQDLDRARLEKIAVELDVAEDNLRCLIFRRR
jgi:hypothetical protein